MIYPYVVETSRDRGSDAKSQSKNLSCVCHLRLAGMRYVSILCEMLRFAALQFSHLLTSSVHQAIFLLIR